MKPSRIEGLDHIANRLIRGLPETGHAHTRKLHGEVMRLRNGLAALEKLNGSRDPTATDAAHSKRMATAAAKYASEVKAANDRLTGIVQSGLKDLEKRILSKVNLTADSYAAELRAAFRSMSSSDRISTLNALVAQNRGPELAAIVKAPALLVGISGDVQGQYADLIVAHHASEEHAEQSMLMEAFNTALVGTTLAKDAASAFDDPAKLAKISKGEEEAKAADKAFADALDTKEE